MKKPGHWSGLLFMLKMSLAVSAFVLLFEDMIKSMDDFFIPMCLAVDNQLMLFACNSSQMIVMFLGKAVVPTRIPICQGISIFLIRIGKLGAG